MEKAILEETFIVSFVEEDRHAREKSVQRKRQYKIRKQNLRVGAPLVVGPNDKKTTKKRERRLQKQAILQMEQEELMEIEEAEESWFSEDVAREDQSWCDDLDHEAFCRFMYGETPAGRALSLDEGYW